MALLTNDIYVGSVNSPMYRFANADIELGGAKGSFALDVIGNELSIDTFSFVVRYEGLGDALLDSNGEELLDVNGQQLFVKGESDVKNFMRDVPYGTSVYWYIAGSLYIRGFLKSVERVGKYGFKLTCVSGVGLLDTAMHKGNMYNNSQFTNVVMDIVGDVITIGFENDVTNLYINGYVPYDTRRNNLHRLLFATGAVLKKGDENSDYYIGFLSSETIKSVPPSRVSLQGSVDYQLPSNRVDVEEHSYFYDANATRETLFDNTDGVAADHLTVYFEKPVYVWSQSDGLKTTGTLYIHDRGVNYAVVSGSGTLTGKYYAHTTQIHTIVNNPDNAPERVRKVEGNGLINSLNSHNVARRVLSYYQSVKTVNGKINADSEQCGDFVRMTDAFGETTQGYLAKMDLLVTSVKGATCRIVDGYEPVNGNNFLHCEVIDAAWIAAHGNTWTSQSDYIRLVLISGGNGGQGGGNGADGLGVADMTFGTITNGQAYAYANGEQAVPQGGAAGNAGTGGKVFITEKNVNVGEVITLNLGVGGNGGGQGSAGYSGTPSTATSTSIGSISSDNGKIGTGYYEPFSGSLYATDGEAGHKGGNGGLSGITDLKGNAGENGQRGEEIATARGGLGGTGAFDYVQFEPGDPYYAAGYANGGGGGGAAYGTNGSAGGNASVDGVTRTAVSGKGGDGATAVRPTKAAYGCGGAGGNGGGAGGNAGAAQTESHSSAYYFAMTIGTAGKGGRGSGGGDGGDGVVIIYW